MFLKRGFRKPTHSLYLLLSRLWWWGSTCFYCLFNDGTKFTLSENKCIQFTPLWNLKNTLKALMSPQKACLCCFSVDSEEEVNERWRSLWIYCSVRTHLIIIYTPLSSSFLSFIMKDCDLCKYFICCSVTWAQYETFFREALLYNKAVIGWAGCYLMYSKTASLQSGAAHWEVRSLSIPFIHSLIQLEGNYRPPRGFKILVGFCSRRGASL